MPEPTPAPETATPSPQTAERGSSNSNGATNLSGSGNRTGNRGGQYRGGYRVSRGEQSIININSADREFKGKNEKIGVLGLPIEKNLKYGISYEDFQEDLMQFSGANLKGGHALKPLIKFHIDPVTKLGAKPTLTDEDAKSAMKLAVWKEDSAAYNRKVEVLEGNIVRLYDIIIGQLTDSMMSEIKSYDEYEEKDMNSDALWLLEKLKDISAGINLKKNEVQSYTNKSRDTFNCKQEKNESLDDFLKRFRTSVHTTEAAGGKRVFLPDLRTKDDIDMWKVEAIIDADATKQEELRKAKLEELENARDKALKERVLAMLFMQNVDKSRYGKKYEEIDEASDLGRDEFPTTLARAFDILVNQEHRVIERHERNRYRDGTRGVVFVQGGGRGNEMGGRGGGRGRGRGAGGRGYSGGTDTHHANGRPRVCPDDEEPVAGINGNIIRDMLCFCCNRYGHSRPFCGEWVGNGGTRQVRNFLYNGFLFNNVVQDFLLKNNIYLIDCAASHSTVSSLDNIKNLTKVLQQDVLFTVTNAGNISFEEQGDLDFLPVRPHINTESVANILAFHELNGLKGAHIKFDGLKEDAFFLVFDSGRVVKFTRCDIGLYFYDTQNTQNHEFNVKDSGFSFLTTKAEIEESMTKKEVLNARKVRFYQELIGWPATKDLKGILDNRVKNADVTSGDVDRAIELGEPEAIPKGKMIRRHPTPHKTRERQKTDPRIKGKVVDVYTDIVQGGKCKFLVTKIGKGQHHQSKYIKNRKMSLVSEQLRIQLDYYRKRGLVIGAVHVDNEFDNDEIRAVIGDAVLHVYAKDEHVAVVERELRTIKERLRCVIYGLPYRRFPKVLIIGVMAHVTEMLNRFPAVEKGFSESVSPAELIDGFNKLDLSKKQIRFGGYAQIWGGTTNTLKERSIGAIALNRSNENGGWYFMALKTGRVWNTNQFLENPISDDVIDRVENMSKILSDKSEFELSSLLPYEIQDRKYLDVPIQADTSSSEDSSTVESEEEIVEEEQQPQVEVPVGVNLIADDSSSSDEDSLLQEVNVEEDGPDVGGAQVVAESDVESVPSNDDEDMLSMVSNSDRNNDIYDFGEDVISSDDSSSGIKEDDPPKQNDQNESRVIVEDVTDDDEDDGVVHEVQQDTRMSENKRQSEDVPVQEERRYPKRTKTRQGLAMEASRFANQHEQIYGTQSFQRKYKQGFSMLQSKYVQAASFLATRMEKAKQTSHIDDTFKKVVGVCFAQQMPASQGFRKFGEKALAAMIKELKQLNDGAMEVCTSGEFSSNENGESETN